MEIIIDLQGFLIGKKKFILKEYAAASVQSADKGRPIVTYGIFKPPCDWKDLDKKSAKANTWLTSYHHGLSWDIGVFHYKYIKSELQNLLEEEDVKKIYVKGLQKKQWLQNIIGYSYPVINLEDIGCPPLDDLKFYSTFKHFNIHQKTKKPGGVFCCALDNVGRLTRWFERHWGVWEKQNISDVPSLLTMKSEDINFLRADFLYQSASNIYIDNVWDKLPNHLKEDPRVAKCRRCRKHFDFGSSATDGTIPMIKDCKMCQKE